MSRIKENRKIVFATALLTGLFFTATCAATPPQPVQGVSKEQVVRVSPQDAYPQVAAGKALLVCAYENEKTCSTIMLERAITLREFQGRLAGLKKDQPIIFYCA
jgi:hypothetical protein